MDGAERKNGAGEGRDGKYTPLGKIFPQFAAVWIWETC